MERGLGKKLTQLEDDALAAGLTGDAVNAGFPPQAREVWIQALESPPRFVFFTECTAANAQEGWVSDGYGHWLRPMTSDEEARVQVGMAAIAAEFRKGRGFSDVIAEIDVQVLKIVRRIPIWSKSQCGKAQNSSFEENIARQIELWGTSAAAAGLSSFSDQ